MSNPPKTPHGGPYGGLSRRRLLIAGLAGGVALHGHPALTADAGPPAKPHGQAVIGYSQEPTVFNPLMSANEVDQGVWWNLFSTLWLLDETGRFVPMLASEIPSTANGGLSADGLTWTIRLRPGVTWHDGAPFTADDVKYTLDLVRNPKFRGGNRSRHAVVADIRVVNDHELVLTLSKLAPPYMALLAWTFMVPKHVLGASEDPNTAPFNTAPIGTGAFKWGERQTGDHVTLVANPTYFGTGPYLERLVFKYIPDLDVMYTQFRSGSIDYIGLQGIPADHYDEAKTLHGKTLYVAPLAAIENLTLNLSRPYFADKAVRQALYLATDKQSIIETIYYGLPKPAESFLPPENWAFDGDLPKHEFDIAKANAILDGAGWKRGADGVRAKDNVRLEFTNSTTSGNHVREQVQQFLVQDWARIGVAMTINNMPGAVIWGKFWSESQFDSLMTAATYTVAGDPDTTQRFASTAIPVKTGTGSNVSEYANLEVDKLLAAGLGTANRDERRQIYQKVQAIIRDDLAFLPLFQAVQVEGTNAALRGYKANAYTFVANTWNACQWYWA